MNQVWYYVASKQGVDSTLVYTRENGKLYLFPSWREAEKIAEEIGPSWKPEPLEIPQ